MKTGIELIAQERQEQIEKHGRTVAKDAEINYLNQLSEAAILLSLQPRHVVHESLEEFVNDKYAPFNWDENIFQKMMDKSYKDRLIIAGALIAAELDRLQFE